MTLLRSTNPCLPSYLEFILNDTAVEEALERIQHFEAAENRRTFIEGEGNQRS